MAFNVKPATGIGKINTLPAPNTSYNLRFPSDLGSQQFNYWMSFSFYEYQRPDISQIQNIFGIDASSSSTYLNDLGTIRLPLPNSMIDHQDQQWDVESVGAAISQAVLNGRTIGSLGNMALGASGYAANPFLAVMYKSPSFKTHNFMWRLTPSNITESEILNKIASTFRGNQLPVYRGPLLGYPNIVQIVISCATQTYFSYAFKPAIIKSFEINWAADGQPSFFNSSQAPTAVEIRMELLEIEYWTQQDYGFAANAPQQISVAPQGLAANGQSVTPANLARQIQGPEAAR